MSERNNKEFEFVFEDDALLSKPDSEPDPPKKEPKLRGQRKPFPVFYLIYTILVLAAVAGIFFAVDWVDGLLYEYELVQPKYKAEEVFAEHFETPDLEKLLEMSESNFAVFESRERVLEHIKGQFSAKNITYSESVKNEAGEIQYNVYCDGVRFASFMLVPGEEKTEHGFGFYELGDIELMFSMPDNSYDFLVPDGYKIIANGITVEDKYICADPVPTDAYRITGGKAGIRYIPYSVSGFLSTPTLKVVDSAGEDVEFFYDEENDYYTVSCDSVTIRIPRGYKAYIENCEVADKFVLDEESVPSAYNEFLEEGSDGLNYIKYEVNGFFEDPKITVKSEDGTECRVRYDEDEALYECYPAYSLDLRGKKENEIIEIFRKYTLYLMYVDYSKSDLKVYFDPASVAWKKFSSINVTWQFEPTKYEFTNESVGEFIKYPDGTFSCRVKQKYTSWRGSAIYEQSIDMTVFFKPSGDQYLIYNMTNTDVIAGMGQPVL